MTMGNYMAPTGNMQAVNLPGTFHPDPEDRILAATARHLGATMITGDAKIHAYPHVKTLW